jgi:hypothetical protein
MGRVSEGGGGIVLATLPPAGPELASLVGDATAQVSLDGGRNYSASFSIKIAKK